MAVEAVFQRQFERAESLDLTDDEQVIVEEGHCTVAITSQKTFSWPTNVIQM